ncbi:FKBP-type peptidyl-prolyl cis-trans isomerase [Methanoregula boonei]|uniref:FKBP-type peptidyl-prolyl cis-trans isomerase n=1 Tax=Methanoregula boonei TaxID=358766 RepID=UPI0006924BD5|nr:FKBP-type peptidyl-prolyl cis-trans isomerase [Methanoregula boonei]
MSEPETKKEETTPTTPEKTTGAVAEPASVPENPAGGETEHPEDNPKKAVPDAREVQKRKKLFIAIGAVIVIIAAVLGAYLLLSVPTAMKGDTVAIYYNESFENGTLYLSAMNATYPPLIFTLGNSSVISGVQDAVIGMSPGEIKTVNIPDAYGAYDPGLVQTVNRTGPVAQAIFGNMTLKPGLYTVRYRTTNTVSTMTILNVTNTTLTLDTNNPLAGYNLTFTIELANLTKANAPAATS